MNTVRRLVREQVAPRAAAIDAEKRFPEDVLQHFAEVGLLGLTIDEELGGFGAPMELLVEVVMEIAAVCANSANILTQQALACRPLMLAGSAEQKAGWLPKLASGASLCSFALTEAEAGSDNQSMRTRARRVGDTYVLEGSKVFCTISQLMTVFARAQDDPEGEGLVALVLELPTEGFRVDRLEDKMGLNGSPTAQVAFSGVEVLPRRANDAGCQGDANSGGNERNSKGSNCSRVA